VAFYSFKLQEIVMTPQLVRDPRPGRPKAEEIRKTTERVDKPRSDETPEGELMKRAPERMGD
jgi:hypothetical protein